MSTPLTLSQPMSAQVCRMQREIPVLPRLTGVPRKAADFIAIGACGNVRDALLRAANFLILGDVTERPKPSPNFIAKSKTTVARAAWQNSRNGKPT